MSEIILVPLDGSIESETVLPYATAIARAQDRPLLLLRVIEPAEVTGRGFHPEEDYCVAHAQFEEADGYLDRVISGLRGGSIVAASDVVSGDPAERILRLAKSRKVGIIAMATHGRDGLDRWAIGSVADKVLRAAMVPTLLVRNTGHAAGEPVVLRRILVPLDGSPLAEAALMPAARLAAATGARLLLLQVAPWVCSTLPLADAPELPGLPQFERAAELTARAYLQTMTQVAPAAVRCEPVVLRGVAKLAIEEYVKHEDVDLVVMSTHGRGGLARMLLGSTADALVRAGVPSLVIRPNNLARPAADVAVTPTGEPAKGSVPS